VIAVGVIGKRVLACVVVVVAVLAGSLGVSSAVADTVVWKMRGVSEPTRFSASDATRCEKSRENCDSYQLLSMNVSDVPSSGTIMVTDKLPSGLATAKSPESYGEWWSCTEGRGNTEVTCTSEKPVAAGQFAPPITVYVTAPAASAAGSVLKNEASIAGGGAAAVVSTSEETLDSSQAPPFGLSEFGVEAGAADGSGSVGAGAHPWELSANLELPTVELPPEALSYSTFAPVELWKSAAVELPLGLTGDPLATPKCTEVELESRSGCPAGTGVGSVEIGTEITGDRFVFSNEPEALTSPLYNMVAEGGYPAEFGAVVSGVSVYFFASVVHTPSGYRLRVADPGIPAGGIGAFGGVFTFYGEPAKVEGGSSDAAFLSNPTRCSAEPQVARGEVESWENPGRPVSREATLYPELSGCGLLGFDPSLTMAPSVGEGGTTQADEPSGYTTVVKVPQTSAFSELATPQVKNVSVTLPEGMALSPSAADGLQVCDEAQIALDSTAPGGCPLASQVGTAEAVSPAFAELLQGRVYLAQPRCGGEGQPACTAASASNGELFELYVEVQGPGFTVKFPGVTSVDPATGRITARFEDLIQQPISEFKLHLKSGPRAPLANPQTCGTASTTSDLTPWSSPVTPDATGTSSFNVDWDGQGGACPAGMPFAPGFSAGTVNPAAGAFSPFTLSFSRHDREQDLSGLSVSTPPGLLGKLSSVALCGEPQAAQGSCSAASQIGTATVAAGAGPNPYWVSGPVYLTGSYKGQPFGLSVVVPAKAGPFNLGNVVVRAAIHVDPSTTALTVTSDPLPQIIDGVPLRVQTVNVTINREGFIFNPTNCATQQITASIIAAQGASANVSSPFTAAGCKTLPFHPVFGVSTQAKTSKQDGASLTVKGAFTAGNANIRSTAVVLPKQLPARLTTIQQACTEAQFAANPAGCPTGSMIGTATATTPILTNPVTGPVYLVSHGGAAFPDVVAVLQGEGITVDLVGSIDIKKDITSSDFATVPDAPISSFTLSLPEGPHSGLAAVLPAKAKGNMCGTSLTMPFTITGQNGAQVKQNVKIQVTGCPKTKPKKKAKKKAKVGKHHKAKKKM
jgi:hypothetical protein